MNICEENRISTPRVSISSHSFVYTKNSESFDENLLHVGNFQCVATVHTYRLEGIEAINVYEILVYLNRVGRMYFCTNEARLKRVIWVKYDIYIYLSGYIYIYLQLLSRSLLFLPTCIWYLTFLKIIVNLIPIIKLHHRLRC